MNVVWETSLGGQNGLRVAPAGPTTLQTRASLCVIQISIFSILEFFIYYIIFLLLLLGTQVETSMVLTRRKMRRPKGKMYEDKVFSAFSTSDKFRLGFNPYPIEFDSLGLIIPNNNQLFYYDLQKDLEE